MSFIDTLKHKAKELKDELTHAAHKAGSAMEEKKDEAKDKIEDARADPPVQELPRDD